MEQDAIGCKDHIVLKEGNGSAVIRAVKNIKVDISLEKPFCQKAEQNGDNEPEEDSPEEKGWLTMRDSSRFRDDLHPSMLLLSHFSFFLDFSFFVFVHSMFSFLSRVRDMYRSGKPISFCSGAIH